MKKVKKALALSLALCLSAAALAGCGGKDEKASVDIGSLEVMTENKMPITTEDLTLTMWTKNNSQGYATGYEDYKIIKEIEDRTGINLEFIHPVGAAQEQLNILLASGDMPDLISYYFSGGGILRQIEEGTYLDLTEYIEKLAPNFNKSVNENERFKRGLAAMGDTIGYMPGLIDDPAYNAYNGYFVRQDWLDKTGLKVPETVGDWETMLKAFRDENLGAGGKTVPFATITSASMNYEIFASAFGLSNVLVTYRVDENGKVSHNVLQPGYREYLETMNRWYEEGLIDPNIFAGTVQQIDSMMLNDELGSVYIDNNNDIPKYMTAKPELGLVAVPYPKSDDGISYSPVADADVASLGFVVTNDCKHPVEAVRFLDYLYSEEASDLLNWGIEGETYTKDADGKKKFTDYVLSNPDGKSPTEALASTYFSCGGIFGVTQYSAMRGLEDNYSDEIKKQRDQSIEYSVATDKSTVFTSLPFTIEELDALSGKTTEVKTYITEMHQKFVLGKEPLENFDKFLENVKKIGLTEIIDVYQKAYDRSIK